MLSTLAVCLLLLDVALLCVIVCHIESNLNSWKEQEDKHVLEGWEGSVCVGRGGGGKEGGVVCMCWRDGEDLGGCCVGVFSVCLLQVCVCVCVCVLWPITVTGTSQDVMDTLCELYWNLKEEDMWAGLFAKRARFPETNIAIAYEQHGFFEQAQAQYEQVSMFMKLEKKEGIPE